jgi:hypothetical protein
MEQAREYWSSNKDYSVGGGVKHWAIKLSHHPHLVLKNEMSYTTTALHAFMAWKGTTTLHSQRIQTNLLHNTPFLL